MSQPYSPELHGQVGVVAGIPVFESTTATTPRILRVPIPGTADVRAKLIVPNWKAFERELWIETTLHAVITRNLGDVLQWLYGERRWVSSSSIYSVLLMRLRLLSQAETMRDMRDSVRMLRLASDRVAGLSDVLGRMPDSGSIPIPPARDLNT